MSSPAKLLLISTSTVYGTGYLDHAEPEIRAIMGSARSILFIPFALADREAYARKAVARFSAMGFQCSSIEDYRDPVAALEETEAVFVGGGNSFRLLKALYDRELMEPIRKRVNEGMIYMGASAGSNLACPTIRTTNDMPIVEPPSLNALNLFPCQINPHYQDADPASIHMGETREERLLQYLEENTLPVLGLREGAILHVSGEKIFLRGQNGVRLFRRAHPPEELRPPTEIELRRE